MKKTDFKSVFFAACQKSLVTFLHASKHATFFVKLCFTKNLAMLAKKP